MRKKDYTRIKICIIDLGENDVLTSSLGADEDYFNPSWVVTSFGGVIDD